MNDPELGRLIVCYWRPVERGWRGGWYPVPRERRAEFTVALTDEGARLRVAKTGKPRDSGENTRS